MKMLKLIALVLLAPSIAFGDDRLLGTWKSDHDQTMHFARAHSVWEPAQTAFLDQLLGHLEITFDQTSLRYTFPDITIETDHKRSPFKGTDEKYAYRIIGSDEDSVAIYVKAYFGRDRIVHLHFVGTDQLWIYSEESNFNLRDLNFREYFKRVSTSP